MIPDPSASAEISATALHDAYMQRCFHLAELGAGYTAPNPMVGAVLVHEGRIIGEGYHQKSGEAHAEVNCLNSVRTGDRQFIPASTLYVSLEPCAHHGKTPPCVDLIIREKIPRVVIGCRDPFPEVDGKGIEKLLAHKVELIFPVLEKEAVACNRRFFVFHQQKRPYIILKWAATANHKIGGASAERLLISNDYSNRLVHQWRTEEAGILVGTQTALTDDPSLTVRLWPGKNPVRIVVDRNLRLPESLKIFDRSVPSVILNEKKDAQSENLIFKKINAHELFIPAILSALYSLNILSVLVEGGAKTLQSFIDSGLWDEARVITNNELEIPDGPEAPLLQKAVLLKTEDYYSDTIRYWKNDVGV
ncbi:MAG: bifunctional diaminohydroxyphosphoribosylaminopyrimidine deaminase/5-amino-6-(5-phosphoribosylamino)uracil reductase RibD [Bacteroidota bacterium]|nr:bifunctional diaminohydroxyphosphoribosylaminopyrimidine deaminase/5-amino-6-(5-phosphoribosylamino)uracil reductase RibD [Bacteroidota bacterium]